MRLTFEYDYRFLAAGIDQLESYLLSSDLFWPTGLNAAKGEAPYPQLTLGALLLSLQRCRAFARLPAQRASFEKTRLQIDALRTHWLSAWSRKATAEFHMRLNMWRDFLMDYREDPKAHFDRYAYEVQRRVMLQLLLPDALDLSQAELQALNGLDLLLKEMLIPGDFIWQADLAESFPGAEYWFLYGSLPS